MISSIFCLNYVRSINNNNLCVPQPMFTKVPINNKFFFALKNIKNILHIFYSSFVGNNNVALAMHLMWMVSCKLHNYKFYFMNLIKLLCIFNDMSYDIRIKGSN